MGVHAQDSAVWGQKWHKESGKVLEGSGSLVLATGMVFNHGIELTV